MEEAKHEKVECGVEKGIEMSKDQVEKEFSIEAEFIDISLLFQGDWVSISKAIENLRKLNNSQKQFSNLIAKRFTGEILSAAQNLRSSLSKLGIQLIEELIPNIESDSLLAFLNFLLLKSSTEKNFLKEIAVSSLYRVSQYHFNAIIIATLMEFVENRNVSISEKAMNQILSLMKANEKDIKGLESQFQFNLLKWLLIIIAHKRHSLAKVATEIILLIKVENPSLLNDSMLSSFLNNDEISKINSISSQPKQEKQSLKDAIKNKNLNSNFFHKTPEES